MGGRHGRENGWLSFFLPRAAVVSLAVSAIGPAAALTSGSPIKLTAKLLPVVAYSSRNRKAQQEVAEFPNVQQLSREFVENNAKICHLRPLG